MLSPRRSTAAAALLFFALVAVVVRQAWLCDDTHITLRTVETWLSGHGLTWNAGERVQTYHASVVDVSAGCRPCRIG